jgi:redox-sensing transcriptional repressor
MGHLGHALARSAGFVQSGFRIVGLFDVQPDTIGEVVAGLRVRHVSELPSVCRSEDAAIGVITTPGGAAQDVCDRMAEGGVSAILNFAPVVLTAPASVQVRDVDFSAELQVLAFYQAHPDAATGRPEAPARAGR